MEKKYGLRKLSIGLVSCVIGFSSIAPLSVMADDLGNSEVIENTVDANESSSSPTVESNSNEETTVDLTGNSGSADVGTPTSNGNEVETTVDSTTPNTRVRRATAEQPAQQNKQFKVLYKSAVDGSLIGENTVSLPLNSYYDLDLRKSDYITSGQYAIASGQNEIIHYQVSDNMRDLEIKLAPLADLRGGDTFTDAEKKVGEVKSNFVFNDIKYEAKVTTNNAFEVSITNRETNKVNTYTFNNGNGTTSGISINGTKLDLSEGTTYVKQSGTDANNQETKIYTEGLFYGGLRYGYKLTIKDGFLLHELTIAPTYIGDALKQGFRIADADVKIDVDTMLNGNDRIPIVSDGKNGAYISDGDITVWLQPVTNLDGYASTYPEFGAYRSLKLQGRTKGDILLTNEDTAIVFKGTQSARSDKPITFAWRDALFTDGINPINNGLVRVKYIDIEGNELAPSETNSSAVDSDYTTTPKTIENYDLVNTPSNANGKVTNGVTTVTYTYKKKQGTVNVNYLDNKGNKIADSTVLKGDFDADWTSTPKTLEKYNLTTKPATETGKYGTGTTTINYVYTKKKSNITVHYVDDKGTKLAPDTKTTADVDTELTLKPADVEKWDVDKKPASEKVVYTLQDQEFTYVYKKKRAKVTVHYILDGEGTKLADDKTFEGNFDENWKSEALDLENYNLKSKPIHESGEFGIVNQDLTYSYTKKHASVTVKYVDEEGKDLEKPTVYEGSFDESWESKPVQLEKYDLKQSPKAESGKFGIKNQTIEYVYAKKTAKVTAHYVDKDGNKLAEDDVQQGVFDSKWGTKAKDIENWQLVESPKDETGEFGIKDQEVSYVYKKKTGKVIVHYEDNNGSKVSDDVVLEGDFDADWKLDEKTINGYDLTKTPDEKTGKFGTETREITLVYTKKAEPKQAVVSSRVSNNNNTLPKTGAKSSAVLGVLVASISALLGFLVLPVRKLLKRD